MRANTLTKKQKSYLQIGVVILLGIFLAIYFLLHNKKTEEVPIEKNHSVYIENSILYAFDDTVSIAQYPNRVSMHYPYLLVIKPSEKVTHIYNLPEQRKEKDIPEGILDYFQGIILKNDGKTTFHNDQDLGILCEKGFIKSEKEILCLTKVNSNNVENKLVSIDTTTKKIKDIYISKNIITDFSFINGKVYMGEIDLYTKQNYLIIDNEKIEVPSVVSLIYEMEDKPYFVSLKGALNDHEKYYKINDDKTVVIVEGKVLIFR